MKKLIIFCLIFVFLMGCSIPPRNNNDLDNENDAVPEDWSISNETLQIYDINNKVIGEFEHYGIFTQTEDSIIYTKIPTGIVDEFITEMDYYRYVFATGDNIKLGTVKNWSHQTFDKVFINNHLYLFVTTDIDNTDKRTLKFLDIDLNKNSMSEIFSEKGGFPYNSMTVVGDRVLMTKVLVNGCNLDEYNTNTQKIKTLLKFDFNDNANTGEAIRQITSDEKTISLLMMKMQTEENVELRIDVYDYNMNFLHSTDISSISSDTNELRQGVVHFTVSNNYLYYANFSSTRFLGKIKDNNVSKIIETDELFEKTYDIGKNINTGLFYQSYENDLYLLNYLDGSIKKATFYADNKKYYMISVSRSMDDKLLISMHYDDPDTGESLTPRLYYINSSDLNFK